MTSQVNPNNIDGTYPVAGQDNDSQGFRDNFTNIRNNFTYVRAEIEDIQNKAVLKTNLNNSTLSNDLLGNAIVGASLTGWRETFNNIGAVSGSITVDFALGNYQKISLGGATNVAFVWPSNTSGQVAGIKLWVNVTNAAHTLTFTVAPTLGDPDTVAGYNAGVITFSAAELANNNDYLFEIFTTDAGATLGLKDLIRNRDIDLSGMSITGNLSVDRVALSGDLVTNGGRINTDYSYVTLANGSNFFANLNYQTLFFDTASSATISNARIALPATAEDGREIALSFLAPVTTLWVSKGNTALVKWLPNNAVSSGNVSVKFVYSTANANWLKAV